MDIAVSIAELAELSRGSADLKFAPTLSRSSKYQGVELLNEHETRFSSVRTIAIVVPVRRATWSHSARVHGMREEWRALTDTRVSSFPIIDAIIFPSASLIARRWKYSQRDYRFSNACRFSPSIAEARLITSRGRENSAMDDKRAR